MRPGVRTTEHRFVGCRFRVLAHARDPFSGVVGECVSVTPWGNDQLRWIQLRFPDGTEKSFAPSHLHSASPLAG